MTKEAINLLSLIIFANASLYSIAPMQTLETSRAGLEANGVLTIGEVGCAHNGLHSYCINYSQLSCILSPLHVTVHLEPQDDIQNRLTLLTLAHQSSGSPSMVS